MHDRPRGAGDALVRPLDQLRPALHQHLDGDVVGDHVVGDELAHEVEVGLAGRREPDLDLLEPHLHEHVEHAALALRIHGVDQGLVAVAQVHTAPQRCLVDGPVGPRAVGERDRPQYGWYLWNGIGRGVVGCGGIGCSGSWRGCRAGWSRRAIRSENGYEEPPGRSAGGAGKRAGVAALALHKQEGGDGDGTSPTSLAPSRGAVVNPRQCSRTPRSGQQEVGELPAGRSDRRRWPRRRTRRTGQASACSPGPSRSGRCASCRGTVGA